MTRNVVIARAVRRALVLSAVVVASTAGTPAFAQDQDQETQTVVVTGSRIVRQDYEANSPIATVSKDALTHNADITIETALNNLPQIVAGGTTTTNNPPNNGQANIDLRGLGANRNLVLVDGRRPMVSANDLTVDVNTIPSALIDSIEVITGGAGAVYGADAVAGVVNMKLKHNFEGFNISGSYSNSTVHDDAEEYTVSALLGGNFAEGKGNAVFAYDHSFREQLLKSQRSFALFATSTTGNPPQGVLRWNGASSGNGSNAPSQAAVDTVFAKYGVAAGAAQSASGKIGFNQDNSLFAVGTFNSPLDVQHFTDPVDLYVNPRFYPDFYSYNFDPVNVLTLPLDRDSFMTDLHYDIGAGVEAFAQGQWTQYNSATGLAPSPVPGVTFASPDQADPKSEVASSLISTGTFCNPTAAAPTGTRRCSFTGGIPVPVTNPFIPADLAQLLASRTGDDRRLVGAGANESFLVSFRPVDAGLRYQVFQNTVTQWLGGLRGPIADTGWRFEGYFSEGRTEIIDQQQGNIDTQKVTDLLGAADGGASKCAGGFNLFGQHKLSQECLDYIKVTTSTTLDMRQRIAQGFITGDIVNMPAGALSSVFGVEYRAFDYTFDPGTSAGPISGFGASDPESGRNSFHDVFTEFSIPLVKDAPWAKTLDLDLAYRHSNSEFQDRLNDVSSALQKSNTYKADISWQPIDPLRVRASYQRAVRAPNFGELFQGGASFPQIFDPCSITSDARKGANAAQLRQLCIDTGLSNPDTFVATPGAQAEIDTGGNTALKPETADSYTLGVVFTVPTESRWTEKLRSSVDYYKIKVKDAILAADPNEGIAACYNLLGTNPTYDPNYKYCAGIARSGDILGIADVNAADENTFAGANGGTIDTSGVDVQIDWGFDADMVGMPANWGGATFNLVVSRLIDYKLQDTPGVPELNYAGTVNYFGGGISLGQTFPKMRAVLNTQWNVDKFSVAVRARYIDSMKNRAEVQFPGETSFTGVGSVTYWDLSAAYRFMEKSEIRLGLNNAFDKQPPTYAPNVQSGTDPSTYDVIGRRAFLRIEVQL